MKYAIHFPYVGNVCQCYLCVHDKKEKRNQNAPVNELQINILFVKECCVCELICVLVFQLFINIDSVCFMLTIFRLI